MTLHINVCIAINQLIIAIHVIIQIKQSFVILVI